MYQYKFDKDNCWYKLTCDRFNTNECNQNCIRYIEMHYLIENSNIPKGKQFSNKNLYLFSKNFGNGKTTWAIKLMQKYFDSIWAGNGLTVRGIFIHVPTFLTKFKEVINKKDEDFELLKQQLLKVDLVIWDDIAAGKLTDYDHTNLLTYIDQRKLNGKSNIYTGNLDENELISALGNRLKSRVWNDSTIVELYGNDRRGK